MPLYDILCTKCGLVRRDVIHKSGDSPSCECGGRTEHIWDRGAPRSHIFHRGWYEHLAPDPLYFDDRGALREYCKRNDLIMEQLE